MSRARIQELMFFLSETRDNKHGPPTALSCDAGQAADSFATLTGNLF
jgi:hypothetical protein